MWPGPCTGNQETRTPELGIQPWSFLEKAWNYMDKTIGKLCVFFPLAASAPNWRCRSHGAGVRMRVWTRFFGTMYAKHCVHGCCFWTWNIGSVQMRYGFVTSPRRVHELGSSYYEPNDFLQSRNIANCSYFASFVKFSSVEFVIKIAGWQDGGSRDRPLVLHSYF